MASVEVPTGAAKAAPEALAAEELPRRASLAQSQTEPINITAEGQVSSPTASRPGVIPSSLARPGFVTASVYNLVVLLVLRWSWPSVSATSVIWALILVQVFSIISLRLHSSTFALCVVAGVFILDWNMPRMLDLKTPLWTVMTRLLQDWRFLVFTACAMAAFLRFTSTVVESRRRESKVKANTTIYAQLGEPLDNLCAELLCAFDHATQVDDAARDSRRFGRGSRDKFVVKLTGQSKIHAGAGWRRACALRETIRSLAQKPHHDERVIRLTTAAQGVAVLSAVAGLLWHRTGPPEPAHAVDGLIATLCMSLSWWTVPATLAELPRCAWRALLTWWPSWSASRQLVQMKRQVERHDRVSSRTTGALLAHRGTHEDGLAVSGSVGQENGAAVCKVCECCPKACLDHHRIGTAEGR